MATEGDNLAHTSWRDDLWLQAYGLNQITVLDYFSLSPFYDRSCSNEQAKQKGLSTKQLAILAPGIEYVLRDAQPPHLFVISRQHRPSPAAPETLQTFYYVLDGTIYQAPSLHAAINSRLQRCRFDLQGAFTAMQQDLHPLKGPLEQTAGASLGQTDGMESDVQPVAEQRLPPATTTVPLLSPESIAKVEAAFRYTISRHPLPIATKLWEQAAAGDAPAEAPSMEARPPDPKPQEVEASHVGSKQFSVAR